MSKEELIEEMVTAVMEDFDLRWPGDDIVIPFNSFADQGFDYQERHHTAFVLAIECLNQHGWFNRERDLREVFDYMEKIFGEE